MASTSRKYWLAKQIDFARQKVDERPPWINEASRFEGSNFSAKSHAQSESARKGNDGKGS